MILTFRLGTFSVLSTAEIFSLLLAHEINFDVLNRNKDYLILKLEKEVNPEVLLELLGGTREISYEDNIYKFNPKKSISVEFKRPRIDTVNGMLTSKLSKILINLSLTPETKTIYDPFCGTGTVLLEAMLMGYNAIGSDLNPRMVKYTSENCRWLENKYTGTGKWKTFVSDARNIRKIKNEWDSIVTESYLGIPRKDYRIDKNIVKNISDTEKLLEMFLKEASGITRVGQRIVVILPRFASKNRPIILSLEKTYSRYNLRKPPIIDNLGDLIYYRKGAKVLRNIFVLERF